MLNSFKNCFKFILENLTKDGCRRRLPPGQAWHLVGQTNLQAVGQQHHQSSPEEPSLSRILLHPDGAVLSLGRRQDQDEDPQPGKGPDRSQARREEGH